MLRIFKEQWDFLGTEEVMIMLSECTYDKLSIDNTGTGNCLFLFKMSVLSYNFNHILSAFPYYEVSNFI